jgi:hypothetical protein
LSKPDDFLSGISGEVWGVRATTRAVLADARDDAVALAMALPVRLRRAAARVPARSVLALAVEREDMPNVLAEARVELERSHHHVTFASTTVGDRGKWENIDALMATYPAPGHDWLLVVDDDVILPRGFLDGFVFLAERFELRIAQPAHRARSHASWQVTRRRTGSVARQTAFVESGPVVGFHAVTFESLLPFPALRAGWGIDARWSALAREHGWRVGVLDALGVRHGLRRVAASYDREEAIAEGRRFLAGKPYVRASEAQKTLTVHRRWA